MKQAKREKSTTTRGHYVTNAKLLPAVIHAKSINKVTDELITMIRMIAERYSRKGNFVGYSFREDMVCAAMMNLCNNALKFNPEKSVNPFSFYTTAIHNSFLQYMADEKKHRMIRDELLIEAGSNPSFSFGKTSDGEVREADSSGYLPANALIEDEDDRLTFMKDVTDPKTGIVTKKEIDAKTGKEVIRSKEIKVRYAGRQPGPVAIYKAEDIIVDENGNITIK